MNKMTPHRFKNVCEDSLSFDSISSLVFCCYNQRNPQFFILLAEMLVSECLYLAFRVFILVKVDFEKLLSAKPLLIFFMIKNFLFIVNQMYRVYSKSNKYKKLKMIEKYKDFILANSGNNLYPNNNRNIVNQRHAGAVNFHQAPPPLHMLKENMGQHHHHPHFNHPNNVKYNVNGAAANGFSFVPLAKSAALAAAATGGQVPLGQAASQSQFYFNEEIAPNQNPYRFAQIYNEQPQIFTSSMGGPKAIANSLMASGVLNGMHKEHNRLSSASAAYINEHVNNSSNVYSHYAHNQNHIYGNNSNGSNVNTLGSTTNNIHNSNSNNNNNNNGGNGSNSAHAPDYQAHRTSLSTLLSESLLEMMDKENELLNQQAAAAGATAPNRSSHHAANLAFCQQKSLNLSVQNNCVSKPGSKFYGLPIKSGGGGSNDVPLNSTSTSSLLKNSSAANLSSASVVGKHFRGAKI
jgi:hypothetical protein